MYYFYNVLIIRVLSQTFNDIKICLVIYIYCVLYLDQRWKFSLH